MYAKHPEMAKRWEEHTPKGKKLPDHVKKHKKKASVADLVKWSGDSAPGPEDMATAARDAAAAKEMDARAHNPNFPTKGQADNGKKGGFKPIAQVQTGPIKKHSTDMMAQPQNTAAELGGGQWPQANFSTPSAPKDATKSPVYQPKPMNNQAGVKTASVAALVKMAIKIPENLMRSTMDRVFLGSATEPIEHLLSESARSMDRAVAHDSLARLSAVNHGINGDAHVALRDIHVTRAEALKRIAQDRIAESEGRRAWDAVQSSGGIPDDKIDEIVSALKEWDPKKS